MNLDASGPVSLFGASMSHLVPARQREFAVYVVEELRRHGFTAYWAGGCVRDQLLGRTPWDYDVATDAKPDEIRQVFGRRRTLAIGAAFGVITVVGAKEAGQVEVTTFRRDAAYSDGRHPDSVSFSSPKEDARRRDFTINGMFFDPLSAHVIDFVGGEKDLQARIVRAIGEPRERITEDKLRMLRGVRFAAIFGFDLEAITQQAIAEMAAEVTVVSPERIAAEIEIILEHPARARGVRLLQDTGLLKAVLPEALGAGDWGLGTGDGSDSARAAVLPSPVPSPQPPDLILQLLDRLHEPTFALALAVLLHAAGQPDVAETVGRRLRLPRHVFERAGWLLEHWGALAGARQMTWSRLQPLLIGDGIVELLGLHDALAAIGEVDAADVAYCRERLALPPHELNPPPLVDGSDLIATGIPRGKAYSRLLNRIRAAQLDGQVTSKEQGTDLARRIWQSESAT